MGPKLGPEMGPVLGAQNSPPCLLLLDDLIGAPNWGPIFGPKIGPISGPQKHPQNGYQGPKEWVSFWPQNWMCFWFPKINLWNLKWTPRRLLILRHGALVDPENTMNSHSRGCINIQPWLKEGPKINIHRFNNPYWQLSDWKEFLKVHCIATKTPCFP